jgi:hypothetical protein
VGDNRTPFAHRLLREAGKAGYRSFLNCSIHVSPETWLKLRESALVDDLTEEVRMVGGTMQVYRKQTTEYVGVFLGGRVYVSEKINNTTFIVNDVRVPIFPN